MTEQEKIDTETSVVSLGNGYLVVCVLGGCGWSWLALGSNGHTVALMLSVGVGLLLTGGMVSSLMRLLAGMSETLRQIARQTSPTSSASIDDLAQSTAKKPPTAASPAAVGEIGISLEGHGDQFVVSSVLPDSPAGKVGIQIGDVIESLNDETLCGKTLDQAMKLLRGEVGSKVVVKVSHTGQNREVSLTRTLPSTPNIPWIKW